MLPTITPATLAFDADGHPHSPCLARVAHAGGLAAAQQALLACHGLPQRWADREVFTIVETGFGPGLNFLATWAAWRADPARSRRLHFISIEKHPFQLADLARLQAAWPELGALAAELRGQWPALLPGIHRLSFDDGRVTLDLFLGDAVEALLLLEARADAFYLGSLAPAGFAQLARLAAPGATLATGAVGEDVRLGLQAAGFAVDLQLAGAGDRQVLAGRFEGDAVPLAPPAARRALVIGAGVAGTSVAERLAARGWQLTVIDEADGPGQGASGNKAGVFRPLPSLDDNRLARITRAGFLYGLRHLECLARAGHVPRWEACGVLHLGRDAKQEGKMRAVVEAHQPPADYLRFVSRDEAGQLAGWPVEAGGWWFPGGGWIQPPTLCAANLAAGGEAISRRFGQRLARLERIGGEWVALDPAGAEIARAPVAILANGVGIRALPQAASLPVRPARGQVSHLPAEPASAPRVVVCRLGYVSPEVDGLRCAGATFIADDESSELREAEHRENMTKLDFILPGFAAPFDPASLAGRVGFRPASPDRLPMIGAVPAVERAERDTPLGDIPRQPGLYAVSGFGARGLVWASLAGELLASHLNGEPLPLERDLVDAMDPARYLLKPPRPGSAGDE